ncbi:MAG: HAD hydrolase family protein [Halobacteriovoraceae bacterium]|nr:HAD hydrolase family protein [Halobacteriovoraceae bacterium]
MNLQERVEKYKEKLSKIKVCAFDVDGILTDGKIWWHGDEVGWNRISNVRDGYGLVLLKRLGFKVGVITGGNSYSVVKRFKENLQLDFVYKGSEDKRTAFRGILSEGYKPEEVLYMGDELFDIPLLKKAGFSATVPEASFDVHEAVDYVTLCGPGNGAVREVIDMLRLAQNLKVEIPEIEL